MDPAGGSAALLVFYRNAANTGYAAVTVRATSPGDGFQPLEALVAADLDGDGEVDIAGIDELTGRLAVSFGTPDGLAPVVAVAGVAGGPIDPQREILTATGAPTSRPRGSWIRASGSCGAPPRASRRPSTSSFQASRPAW